MYLAEDLKHDPKVAAKVLRPELAAVQDIDHEVVARAEIEQVSETSGLDVFVPGRRASLLGQRA